MVRDLPIFGRMPPHRPVSAIRRTLAWFAATPQADGKPLKRLRKQLVLAWHAMLNRSICQQWYEFLDSPEIRPFVAANRALPLKPLKPYLSLGLNVAGRARLIQDSLRLLADHWAVFEPVIAGTRLVLSRIELTNGETVSLCLEFNLQKEGELTLLLRLANGDIAAISAFAFDRQPDGRHFLRVARIQGVKNHELLRMLEKEMHGLRPKSLMVFATQEVAHALGVSAIFGVSNANQVYNKKVLIALPGLHKLAFDYDSFWLESNGTMDADGWFCLPTRLQKRETSEMKRNKRPMYKKRYAMFDDISAQIHRALQAAPSLASAESTRVSGDPMTA